MGEVARIGALQLSRLLSPSGESAVGGGPAYQQLANGIRRLVMDGRLVPGTRLPSERALTDQLGISRTTVTRAYELLRDRGYLASLRGSGSVVRLPANVDFQTPNGLDPSPTPGGWIDLTCAAPPAPPGVASAYTVALERLPALLSGTGYHPMGLPELREVIASRFTARGLPTTVDQILVTSGALAGLAIVARTFTGAGDRVLLESPTYPNAVASLRGAGPELVGIPVVDQSDLVPTVTTVIQQHRARLALLIPDFQNPTGLLMPDDVRAQIAAALRTAHTLPVIDETLAEVNLSGGPMPQPFAVHAPQAITVGGAGKSHWGGFRVGWVRASTEHIAALQATRLALDLGTPILEQLAAAEFLTTHDVVGHLEQYRQSRDLLVRALTTQLPDWQVPIPDGGLSLWCALPRIHSTALATAAEREHLLVTPGSTFAVHGTGLDQRIRLPFALPPTQLQEAVDRLKRAWDRLDEQAPRRAELRRHVVVV